MAPTPVNKTRARDLLRKHYGLGVGHPPPLTKNDSGSKANVNDPMDLGGFTMKFVFFSKDNILTHTPQTRERSMRKRITIS